MNDRTVPYAAALLRTAFGTMLLAHGLLKIFVFTLPGTVGFFASQGFPGWAAYPVVLLEVVGGALILLGIQSRAVALASLPVLLGAVVVHLGNGWVFSAPNGGWEYPAMLVVIAVVVAMLGDGAFALGKAGRKQGISRAVTA